MNATESAPVAEVPDGITQTNDEPIYTPVEGPDDDNTPLSPDADTGEEPAAEPPAPYTAEELTQLLETDGVIDAKRLSAEGRAVQKTFERGYTPKFQRLAEAERQIKAAFDALQAQAPRRPQPQDVETAAFQEYLTDTPGFISRINTEIQRRHAADPFDPAIPTLQGYERLFAAKKQDLTERQASAHAINYAAQTEIVRNIPDFEARAPELGKFALSTGLEPNDMRVLMDLGARITLSDGTVMPLAATSVRFVKALNKMHGLVNAPASADKKEVKTPPAPLARGGGSDANPSTGKVSEKEASSMSFEAYKTARKAGKIKF